MIRRPPIPTRPDTLFPYPTLFRSLDDVAAVIVHAHGVTWSTNLIVALAERGAIMLLCGSNHAPVAVCLPLDGHHAQNGRIRAQWEAGKPLARSEEHTSELQSLMRISYAVFCLKKKKIIHKIP